MWKSLVLGPIYAFATSTAFAQHADVDAIKAADEGFYKALSNRDLAAMVSVRADKPYIVNISPSSKSIAGRH